MPEYAKLPRPSDAAIATANRRAYDAIAKLLSAAGPGSHCLYYAGHDVNGRDVTVNLTVQIHRHGPVLVVMAPPEKGELFTTALTFGIEGSVVERGGVILRDVTGPRPIVRGWAVTAGWLQPLSADEIATCYERDPVTGDPMDQEPGLIYADGFPLPEPDGAHPSA
ncbi:hypothetical protein [Streptomyces sp. 8N706]|uniref:hypothetical protein n=1 Tax=Streptomyces sp. 8N706 TaxID=3457416 RepID=UPI003FD5C857